jgi:hypothetical protein
MIHKGKDRLTAAIMVWLMLAGMAQAGAAGGIAGQVKETGSGTPIEGAMIVVYDASGQSNSVHPSDRDGHFDTGPILLPGAWYVRAETPDHIDELFDDLPCELACDVRAGTPVMVAAGASATADFSLDRGGAIAGSVTGPGGVPVANATVVVRRPDGQILGNVVTDGDGHYLTGSNLPAGNYRVSTASPFDLIDELYPDLACPGGNCPLDGGGDVAVSAGNVTAGIDFQLAAGARLSGHVRRAADGAAIANALVFVGDAQHRYFAVQPTGAAGEWRSPSLPPGEWRLFTARSGGLLGRHWSGTSCDADCDFAGSAAVQVSGTASVADLDFALEAGAVLTGTVTAAAGGAPVANALVAVFDPARGRVVANGYADPDGHYATEAFLPGEVKLSAIAGNFLMAAFGANCEPDCDNGSGAPIEAAVGATPGFDFALQSGGGIRGLVSGPNGPLANVQVFVYRSNGQVATMTVTGPDGRYDTGTSLGAGDYRVRTTNQAAWIDEAWPDLPCVAGRCAVTTGGLVSVATGQHRVADFSLAAGALIAGRVRRADGQALTGEISLRLSDEAGLDYLFSAGPDGRYDTRTGLAPGNYRLIALGNGNGLLSEAWQEQPCGLCPPDIGTPIVVAGSDVVAGIDFTLDGGATLSGRVLDAARGDPVAGATVLAFDPQTNDVLTVGTTGLDGRYTTQAFLPADVLALVQAPGYLDAVPGGLHCDSICQPEEGPLLHAASGNLPGIDFELRRGAGVSGRVQTPGGAPMAGTLVSISSSDLYFDTHTDAAGDYAFEQLPNGRYLVYAEGSGPYVATAWPSEQCVTNCNIDTRATLTLQDDAQRTDIDITLIEGGRVRGRVEGMPGNIAQPGSVDFYELESLQFAASAPLAAGDYLSDPLPPGQYLAFTVTTGGYIDEMFDDVPCPYVCSETLGTPIAVVAGGQATADFELEQGGRIAGRIFNAVTNAAFPSRPAVQVRMADNTLVWSGNTQANGNYITAALPPGTYYVRSRNRSGFLDEFFLDEDCFWCAPVGGIDVHGVPVNPTPVGVTLGAVTTNIDFGLHPGRRLGGRITVEPDGSAAQSAVVQVFDATGRFIVSSGVFTDGGWFSLGGFPPGTYYLRTVNSGRYYDETYGGGACSGSCDVTQGTPVVLGADADRMDLDFALVPLPQVFANGFE